MTKELQLERLDHLIKQMSMLKPEQFDYRNYITVYNREESCGTVCCFLGWAPKLVPELGLVWKPYQLSEGLYLSSVSPVIYIDDIRERVATYYDLTLQQVNAMFYGAAYIGTDLRAVVGVRLESISLEEGLNRLKVMRDYIANH